jgi:hypothetical protein
MTRTATAPVPHSPPPTGAGRTTGELMADDVTCPECGTPQWVTGTRDHESGQG